MAPGANAGLRHHAPPQAHGDAKGLSLTWETETDSEMCLLFLTNRKSLRCRQQSVLTLRILSQGWEARWRERAGHMAALRTAGRGVS